MNFLGFVWGAAQPEEIAIGLNLVLRVGLSGTFLASAVGKFVDLPGARQALGDFGVPSSFVRTGTIVLCYAELAVALGLIVDQTSRWACVGAILLMLGIGLGVGRLLVQKRTPPCHCFGALHSAPVGWVTFARAILLAILAAIAMKLPNFTLTSNALSFLGVLTVFATSGYALKVYAKKLPSKTPGTLQVGQRLPAVRLRDGRWIENCLPDTQRTVLIFTAVGCSACEAIKAPLSNWDRTLKGHLPILHVRGVTEDEPGVEFQLDRDDLSKFRIGTPGAILVDRSGVIMAPPVSNLEQIEALMRVTLRELRS